MSRARKAIVVGLGLLLLGFIPDATTAQERVNPQRVGGGTQRQQPRTNNDANLELGSGGYNARQNRITTINRDPYRPTRNRNGNLTYASGSSFTPMFRYRATTFSQPYANTHSRRFRGYAGSYR
jgi:hypothetical protein